MAETLSMVTQLTDATPPHSTEAEQALLGAILLDNKLYDELGGMLSSQHFYHEFYGEIFRTIERLLDAHMNADAVTVKENIKDVDRFENTDVTQTLLELAKSATLVGRIKDHARVIKTRYLQRELMSVGLRLNSEARVSQNEDNTAELINNTESELFKLGETSAGAREATDLQNPLKNVIDMAAEARKNDSTLTGITSGLSDLDEKLNGFQKSDLIILAARPSMGKTALAVNMAYNAAQAMMMNQMGGTGVGIFSLEMSAEQLASRILSAAAEVDSYKIDRGNLNDDEFRRIQATAEGLCSLPLVIDDTPQLHVAALRARARRMVRQHNVGCIIVDYLQLMSGSSKQSDGNRVQEISEISRGLKHIARELNIPVIALSQLSRAVEARDNKRPQLADLRESGSIEQDADIVLFLYREEYYKERQFGSPNTWSEEQKRYMEKIRGAAELNVAKNRKGPVGSVVLTFIPQRTLFRNHADTAGYESHLREGGNEPT